MHMLASATPCDEDDISECMAMLAVHLSAARDFLYIDAGRAFDEIMRAQSLVAEAVHDGIPGPRRRTAC